MTFDIIIVGSGLAGYTLAKTLRQQKNTASIAIVTNDDGRFYSKPLLSTGFAKNKSADELASKTALMMADELDISVFNHTQVQSIDRQNKALTIKGEAHPMCYQQALVLATGAAPIQIPLPEALTDRCFAINDLHDYQTFRDNLAKSHQQPPRVAIIGSGLVGTEYANDLTLSGAKVSVISLDQSPLQLLLPTELGQNVQSALSDKGVDWHFNTTIESATCTVVNGDKKQITLTLKDGNTVECDIVLSAVGLAPRDPLAKQAGLETNKGIVVDEYLQTNDPNIYALGDCARINGVNLMYVAILTLGAKALTKTLSGDRTPLKMPASPVIVKTPSCPVVASPPEKDAQGSWQIEGQAPDLRACFYDNDMNLLGFGLTGKAVMERMKLAKQLPPIL